MKESKELKDKYFYIKELMNKYKEEKLKHKYN
jgi:hypothetical protein